MPFYTLSQMQAVLDPTCFPPGASAAVQTSLLNKVRFMFYNSPHGQIWRGTDGTLALAVVTQPDTTKTVTLPRGWQTLLGLFDSQGDLDIANQWFAYVNNGQRQKRGDGSLIDLGEGFCGVANLPAAGATMQIQTTVTEAAGLGVTFVGTDANGNSFSEKVTIPAIAGQTATTAATFYSITQVIKDKTAGDVIASIVGTPNVFFSRWQAGELSPDYRRYQFNFEEQSSSVYALCKRAYVDLAAASDPMDINNPIALELGLRAYRYMQNADLVHAGECFQRAVDFLNGELSRDESDAQMGCVQIEYEQSGGAIRNLL